MELVKPGIYIAKIVDYGFSLTKAGAPQAKVTLEFMEDGQKRQLTWFGGFGEKQIKHTLKALITCGLCTDVEAMADGLASNALDLNKELSIVVEHNNYNGKISAKVCWINEPIVNKFATVIAKPEVRAKLAALNLKGELAAMRQQMGVKAPAPQPAAGDFDPNFDVGF